MAKGTLRRPRLDKLTAPHAASNGSPLVPAPVRVDPPGPRRRPRLLLAAVLVIVLGGLAGAWLYTSLGSRTAVIAVATDIAYGQVLTEGMLRSASISASPDVESIPFTELDSVLGERAAVDLPAGSLLTRAAVAAAVIPAEGEALVPVALAAEQVPATGLRPGDLVRLLGTAGDPTGVPVGEVDPAVRVSVEGTVLAVSAPTVGGNVVVDVLVDEDDGDSLAVLAAEGRLALLVLSREDG